ncbi:MAG: hypothetical protein ACK50J_26330, partial [Planctomyces sp.]
HNPTNLPTLLVGGGNMGIRHGSYWHKEKTPMSNLFLSILQTMQIPETSFADSTGVLSDSIFSYPSQLTVRS